MNLVRHSAFRRGFVALTAEDAGTATMTKVVGHVEVSPGDRLSYRTLTRPEDPDCWLSIEPWDSG